MPFSLRSVFEIRVICGEARRVCWAWTPIGLGPGGSLGYPETSTPHARALPRCSPLAPGSLRRAYTGLGCRATDEGPRRRAAERQRDPGRRAAGPPDGGRGLAVRDRLLPRSEHLGPPGRIYDRAVEETVEDWEPAPSPGLSFGGEPEPAVSTWTDVLPYGGVFRAPVPDGYVLSRKRLTAARPGRTVRARPKVRGCFRHGRPRRSPDSAVAPSGGRWRWRARFLLDGGLP